MSRPSASADALFVLQVQGLSGKLHLLPRSGGLPPQASASHPAGQGTRRTAQTAVGLRGGDQRGEEQACCRGKDMARTPPSRVFVTGGGLPREGGGLPPQTRHRAGADSGRRGHHSHLSSHGRPAGQGVPQRLLLSARGEWAPPVGFCGIPAKNLSDAVSCSRA